MEGTNVVNCRGETGPDKPGAGWAGATEGQRKGGGGGRGSTGEAGGLDTLDSPGLLSWRNWHVNCPGKRVHDCHWAQDPNPDKEF